MIAVGYDNIVLTKVITRIWEHGDIAKKKYKQPYDQTGRKQDNSLDRLSKTLNLEVKLKVSAPENFIIIP